MGSQPKQQATDRFWESEERFRRAFEDTGVGMLMLELDGKFRWVNKAFCKMLGYSKREILTKSFSDITFPEDLAAGLDGLKRMNAREITSSTAEKRFVHKKGYPVWVELNASIVFDDDENPSHTVCHIHDISDRKRAEEELRQSNERHRKSEERHRSLFESSPIAMIVTNDEAGIVHANVAAVQLYRAESVEQLIGLNTLDLVHPDDRGNVLERRNRVFRGDRPPLSEFTNLFFDGRRHRLDGSEFISESRGIKVDWEGTPAILLIIRDITEQKRTELARQEAYDGLEEMVDDRTAKLKRSENQFRQLIEQAPDAIYVQDFAGNILITNNEACVQTGYTQEEILKLNIRDLSSVSKGAREENLKRLLEGEQLTHERIHRRKDGSTLEVESHIRFGQFEDQNIFIGFVRDVSKRKGAEETIRKLSSAGEQNPSMGIITDKDGIIEYVNPKFTEISGYTAAEAIGQKPNLLKSGVTPHETYTELWNTIREGREWHGEVLDKRKDGTTIWVSLSINPIRNEAGEISHFVSMEEDITERKQQEMELIEAREQAEIANRSKTEFLANMSHELRTPLNAIIGYSEAVGLETFGPLANDKQKEYLKNINESGHHLLSLINDVLDVSVIEAGKLELRETEVHLNDAVEASVQMMRSRAEFGGVKLVNSVDGEAPVINADELRIKQILVNLLSNALKFTPVAGEVAINTEIADDNSVLIIVSDTGIGMDAKDIAKALEKFGQAERGDLMQAGEGTGLGLPLTKGLVEAHGGTLKIESEPNKGTTVTIRIPQERVLKLDLDRMQS